MVAFRLKSPEMYWKCQLQLRFKCTHCRKTALMRVINITNSHRHASFRRILHAVTLALK
jgi:hypothetical protein